MKIPPAVLKVRVDADNGKRARLWLPIFLISPLVLAFALILFPFVFPLGFILSMVGKKEGMLLMVAGPRLLDLVCALRGLRADVRQANNSVHLELK